MCEIEDKQICPASRLYFDYITSTYTTVAERTGVSLACRVIWNIITSIHNLTGIILSEYYGDKS